MCFKKCSPETGVNPRAILSQKARVEDEYRAVDGLGGGVPVKGGVNRDAVHIGVHEPNVLHREEFAIVLAREMRLGRLRAVELRPLRIRSRSTYNAGFAFMILTIAACMSGFTPGNQLP